MGTPSIGGGGVSTTYTHHQDLTLAGNALHTLGGDSIARLTNLRRLQVAGNMLQQLPDALCSLVHLEGLWVHGNLLTSLPTELHRCVALTQLSIAGNCITRLPEALPLQLQELAAGGNGITELPAQGLGSLASLQQLALHGNALTTLPDVWDGLLALQALWLQGNRLTCLPPSLCRLPSLKELSVADNALTSLPEVEHLPVLESVWAYGNRLTHDHGWASSLPSLRTLWLEDNARGLHVGATSDVVVVGVDDDAHVVGTSSGIRPSRRIVSGQPGYFKLTRLFTCPQSRTTRDTIVVAFGSAPGTPNWGGLLSRLDIPEDHKHNIDVLYVVDPARAWYHGGDDVLFDTLYYSKLQQCVQGYTRRVMLGDSMGATGALLASDLATHVVAFCPQTSMATSSIRPGKPQAWLDALSNRCNAAVRAAQGVEVHVHVGAWEHDLQQGRALPEEAIRLHVWPDVESHRLALALDRRGKLASVVRGVVVEGAGVRVSNLL